MADGGWRRVGRFHPKCTLGVVLSAGRSVASGRGYIKYTFSNDPIPIGIQFSVMILQKGSAHVSP